MSIAGVLAAPASIGQDMSDGYRMSHTRAVVTSGADGKPIDGIDVTVEATAGIFVSTSDSYGYAVFPELPISPGDVPGDPSDPIPPQERVTVSVSHPDYVPVHTERVLAEGPQSMQIPLIPRTVGGTTSWIDASTGGVFTIPGLGTLTVPAGALTQDAFLHVTTVPARAQSGAVFDDQLVHQVWLGSLDQNRQWSAAIPAYYNGIELRTRSTIEPFPDGEVYSESWTSHLVDDQSNPIDSMSMTTPTSPRADIPVASGSNLVTRTWDTGTAAEPMTASGCSTSTEIIVVEIDSRFITLASTPMRCGEYDNNAGGEVEEGDEYTSTESLDKETMSEVTATVESVAVELEAKTSSTVTVSTSESTTTS